MRNRLTKKQIHQSSFLCHEEIKSHYKLQPMYMDHISSAQQFMQSPHKLPEQGNRLFAHLPGVKEHTKQSATPMDFLRAYVR